MSNWYINFHFALCNSSGKSYPTPKTRSDNEPTCSGVSWHASMDFWWPLLRVLQSIYIVASHINFLSDTRAVQRSLGQVRHGSLMLMQPRCGWLQSRPTLRPRVLGIVQVSPLTPRDLKNTPKHPKTSILGRIKTLPPSSCLIRQLMTGRFLEIVGDYWEIQRDKSE